MNKEQALQEIKSRLKALFTSEETSEVKLYRCETKDGTILETDGDNLEVGAMIYKIDNEGNRIPAEDGVYPTSDYTITIQDGTIQAISEPEVEVEIENPEEPVEAGDYKEEKMMVTPNADESKEDFISRCIGVEVTNGYEQDQAAAMCYLKWDESMGSDKMESEKDETKMSELESKVLEMSNMITSLIDITEKLNEKIVNLSNQPAVTPVILEKNLTPAELRVERLKSLTKNK
jgi:hypothetical protein